MSISRVEISFTQPLDPVVALLVDDKSGRYHAIGRPQDVAAESSADIRLGPPAPGTSDLLVVVKRPSNVGRVEDDDVDFIWSAGGGARPPDVRLPTTGFVSAIWYGLAGEGSVRIRSDKVAPEALAIRLEPGRAHRVDHALRAR